MAVNSDSSVRKIKAKNRPVINQADRLKTIAALESVDFVVLFNEDNPLKVIKAIKPDVLIKGADWSRKNIIGANFVSSYGGKVLTVNLTASTSGFQSATESRMLQVKLRPSQ